MVDYTKPLADPVIEAAEEILCSISGVTGGDKDVKDFVRKYPGTDQTIIGRAGIQIDHLRAIGEIPSSPMATDYPRLTQGYQPRSTGKQPLDPPIGGSSVTRPNK